MKKEILYLIIVMALSSCTKKIDINLDEDYKRLVVYGEITNEKQVHSIELSETTDFFDEEPAKRISDAIVIVDDGFSQDTLQESAIAAGVYETTADYEGIPGRTYTLRIELPEKIGVIVYIPASVGCLRFVFSIPSMWCTKTGGKHGKCSVMLMSLRPWISIVLIRT